MAELVKHIDTHIEMDFMMVSSYHGGTASSGVINIKQDVTQDIKGRHVLFVEDIIDTGQTLKNLRDMFIEREAASVKIATLLDKPEGRVVEIEADYTCFTIPNEFVVGYGLDYKENYRNLPYVGVLKEEVYSNQKDLSLMKKQNNGLVRNPFLYLLIIFFLVTGFQYFYSGNTAGRSEKN